MSKKQSTPPVLRGYSRYINALLLTGIFAGMILLQSAVWAGRTFFSTETFSSTVTTSLTSQSSRDALATEIVNKALAERPVAKRIIGERLSNSVSSILGSNLAESSVRTLSEKLQMYLTTENQKTIAIDTTGVKNVVSVLSNVIGSGEEQTVAADKIPDQIVIVDSEKVPSYYKIGKALYWLSPVSAALALGCAIAYIRRQKHGYKRIYVVCATVAVSTVTALGMGPLLKPSLLELAKTTGGRTVMGNLYDSFLVLFNNQLYLTFVLAALVAAVAYLIQNQQTMRVFFKTLTTKATKK